jgi:gas vesicle protein
MQNRPWLGRGSAQDLGEHLARRENSMTKGRTVLGLLIGFGVGVGLTLLFAPQSGEDTRYWIALTSRRARRRVRNTSRRSIEQVRDMIERGQETVSKVIRSRGNGAETEVTEL